MARRVYYHYSECEEFATGGMWRIVAGKDERERYVKASAELMADPDLFRAAMMRALTEWPKSVETNLTSSSTNHRAWFGHAGCFLATGSPEDCTRLGWHALTAGQQNAANAAADDVIAAWEHAYYAGREIKDSADA